MYSGARSLAFVVICVVLAGLPPLVRCTSDVAKAGQEPKPLHVEVRPKAAAEGKESTFATMEQEKAGKERIGSSEAEAIKPIKIPFKQGPNEWGKTGISLTAYGEPKSGTTWLARIVTELCVQLCGNPENTWCKMGGLTVNPNVPAPWYDFEMLDAKTGELYLHFKGWFKHEIPGIWVTGDCGRGSTWHKNDWGDQHPCHGSSVVTRDILLACLPDASPACIPRLPTRDPSVRRMAVIFRDARNLMISEHRMRKHVYHHRIGELEPFIRLRFEAVVAWIHQRWVWHTTFLKDVSHVMFYEDLQAEPHHLVDLAAFLGLDCTPAKAEDVWRRHIYTNPPGDYTMYGLSHETLEWMNTTMASLLPIPVLERYGLTPIYT